MSIAHPPTHDEISQLAYRLWQERGAPIGSPDVDWARAEEELCANGRASDGEAAMSEASSTPSAAAARSRRGARADHHA